MGSNIYNDSISTVVVEKIKKFLFFSFVINDIILVLSIKLKRITWYKASCSVITSSSAMNSNSTAAWGIV